MFWAFENVKSQFEGFYTPPLNANTLQLIVALFLNFKLFSLFNFVTLSLFLSLVDDNGFEDEKRWWIDVGCWGLLTIVDFWWFQLLWWWVVCNGGYGSFLFSDAHGVELFWVWIGSVVLGGSVGWFQFWWLLSASVATWLGLNWWVVLERERVGEAAREERDGLFIYITILLGNLYILRRFRKLVITLENVKKCPWSNYIVLIPK